jgi:hypothetical protein
VLREVERRETQLILHVEIRAVVEQQLDCRNVVATRGHHERRGAVGRARVDIGRLVEQQLHDIIVAVRRRVMQRRPALLVDLGALRDQELHEVEVAVQRREHHRVLARLVLRLDIRLRIRDERRGHLVGLLPRREHEERDALVVGEVRVHAVRELLVDFLHVVELHGLDHRVRGRGLRGRGHQRAGEPGGERQRRYAAPQHSRYPCHTGMPGRCSRTADRRTVCQKTRNSARRPKIEFHVLP